MNWFDRGCEICGKKIRSLEWIEHDGGLILHVPSHCRSCYELYYDVENLPYYTSYTFWASMDILCEHGLILYADITPQVNEVSDSCRISDNSVLYAPRR